MWQLIFIVGVYEWLYGKKYNFCLFSLAMIIWQQFVFFCLVLGGRWDRIDMYIIRVFLNVLFCVLFIIRVKKLRLLAIVLKYEILCRFFKYFLFLLVQLNSIVVFVSSEVNIVGSIRFMKYNLLQVRNKVIFFIMVKILVVVDSVNKSLFFIVMFVRFEGRSIFKDLVGIFLKYLSMILGFFLSRQMIIIFLRQFGLGIDFG